VALLVGPAAKIPLEQFPLTPDPPEFEKLLGGSQSQIDFLDQLLIPHQSNVHTDSLAAIADLDADADTIAAIQKEADAVGILEETGVIQDILDAAGQFDGTGTGPAVSGNISRVDFAKIAVGVDIPVVVAPPAPAAGVTFTQPINRQPI